ncbi:MAG: uroporphyrinogen decarboxylase family protein [Armatimonadota bacterium]
MLPRERVLTTLEHREPDLVPWGEHSIDYSIYEMVLGRETWVQAKFKETKGLWDGRRDEIVASYKRDIPELAEALGFDIVTVPLAPAAGAEHRPMEQIDHETFRDRAGNLHRISATTHKLMPYKVRTDNYQVPTLEQLQERIDKLDAEGLQKPDDSCWETIRHVVAKMKATHWINTCVGGFGFPTVGPTDEEQYLNLALHPELHAKTAELNAKRCMATLPWYAEEGLDSIMPCADLGSSTALFASPKILEQHVAHWWTEYVRRAHQLGLKVVKHCCGCIWEALPFLAQAGFDGYEGIQASGGMDMKRLKERYGDRLTLWGGVWNEHLILGGPQDIEADARYAIKWGAPGGGFIYGATHSLAVGTKPENLERMKTCRERYGVYPINVPS